ncbi:hypothetical protein PAMA_005571 [Pampus argenteus]
MEKPPPASSQDVHTDDSMRHVQMNDEMPTLTPKQQEPVYSLTTAVKKVKFTTIVTLHKENLKAADIASPEVVKQVENKSNLSAVVTLQKETTLEDCPIESSSGSQHDVSMTSDVASSTNHLSPSNQQIQGATVHVSTGQTQYTEGEGNLSSDLWGDEGPPPPPTGKISLHSSKTRVRTQCKVEDLTKMNGSNIETVAGDDVGEFTYLAHENESVDIQSAYKRMYTIFEYEADLNGIFFPESIVDKEETNKGEEEQDRRTIYSIDTNSDITGNGQKSLHMQYRRPPADNGSIPDNQDQGKLDSFKKTEKKRKFKFKFPKNKLAAIHQSVRTRITKTGRKILEVVEEVEEVMPSDSMRTKDTKKQTKESKRFNINSAKLLDLEHVTCFTASRSSSSSPAQRSHTQQAIQKQPSQADSRASRAAGDSSHSVVALRASKIPGLCHSSGKQPSASLSTPHCSDAAENLSSSSSSCSSSSASSPSASSSSRTPCLLSPPINVSKCPSRLSSPSSVRCSRLSSSSLVKISSVSTASSPPRSPSSPSFSSSHPPHKSSISSLNLTRLLPLSSHVSSPSHASVSPAPQGPRSNKRQHRLALTSTSTSQHSYYSSSSCSSSSLSSSSTSSSLSPTSSSPPSPSSFLLPTMMSHGVRSVRASASSPASSGHSKKGTRSQDGQMLQPAAASKDAS